MANIENIVAKNGYLVDGKTGKRVVFYECDPSKNTECDRMMCRADTGEDDSGFGLCAKTINPRFRKDGGKSWYAVMKTPDDGSEPYWGREYI